MYQRPAGVSSSFGRASLERRPADSRFTANSFQYNGRVAAALLPCILVLLGAGGAPVAATLVVGLMISYILDTLQMKQSAFLAIWAALLATAGALFFSGAAFYPHVPSALSYLIVLTSMHLVFLSGVWASLQFRWLQLEHPTVVVSLERVLFACIPFTAAAIQTWGVVAAVGIAHAPFYLMPILFTLYWLFSLPRISSFGDASSSSSPSPSPSSSWDGTNILGPLEECIHTLQLLFLPLLFHLGIHHSRFLYSWSDACDLLLLFFVPLLFQVLATTRGALSWLYTDSHSLRKMRIFNGAVAIAVVLGCLEVRIIFTSFGHYIQLPPPLNYLLVTLALYGGGLGFAAYAAGVVRGVTANAVASAALVSAALAGALALGMPLQILPAPAIAAVYVAQYLSSGSLVSYFIGGSAAGISAAWFLLHNFWFLDTTLGGLSLQLICQLLIGSLALSLAIPGLALLPKSQPLVGGALIAQAILVCKIENRLYNFGHDEEGLYPSYLVVVTSVTGLLIARRLEADLRIGTWSAWITSCLFLGKMAILLVASPNVVWAAGALLLAVSPPLLLYREKKGKSSSRMKPWQAASHAVSIIIAVGLCRYTVFDSLRWWTGHPPSGGLLLGAFLLLTGAACTPLVTMHFPNVQGARKVVILLLATGLLFVLLQPPVPTAWNTFWDSEHIPELTDGDEFEIYGSSLHGPSWPSWLLLGALLTGLAGATSVLPVVEVAAVRFGVSAAVGALLGVYLCAEYFSKAPLIHLLLVASTTVCSILTAFIYKPSTWSPRGLPWLFICLVALLPATWLLQGQTHKEVEVDGIMHPDYMIELTIQGVRNSVVGMYCALFMLIALVAKVKVAALIHSKGGAALPNHSPFAPKHRNIQKNQNFLGQFNFRKLAAEGAWLPVIGNASTMLCFALGLVLNSSVTAGSERAIFFLAPVLLLLNQDPHLLSGFSDRQRYFPLALAVSSYLVLSASWLIFDETRAIIKYSDMEVLGGASLLFLAKDLAFVGLSIPSHLVFCRFLWDYARQPEFILLITGPLNLPGTVLAGMAPVRALAILGVVFAVTQALFSRHIRTAGLKFI